MEQRNIFTRLLSLISYKEKEPVKEFYIPEANVIVENPDTNKEQEKEPGKTVENNTEKNKGIKKPTPITESKNEKSTRPKPADDDTISTDIEQNKDYIKKRFNFPTNKDIVIREFIVAEGHKAFIAYLDGMVDKAIINNFVLRPLLTGVKIDSNDKSCQMDFILTGVLQTNQAKKIEKPTEAVYEILTGNTLLYLDNCDFYITNETKGFPTRGVEKPMTEGVVTGAQEAFNETLRTNTSLIRKAIKNSSLTTEFIKVGKVNQAQCAIMYLKDIANPAIVNEVKRRIESIDTDFVNGDGILEQFVEDRHYSVVPTMLTTERPDRTVSHIMEGRVSILVEGTPFAKIVPVTAFSLIHSPEDAIMRWPFGTTLRLIRVLAMFIATLLPGLYVAITNFHQEMIPTDLLLAIVKAKENVPFPTVIEVLLMEISFELIREAGIRIPGIIGNTLGIIGALILGQAAVQANIVSPVLIIIVAVTGLGNFAIPNYNLALAIRLIRFSFIILGALVGFYGITIGIALISVYLLSIKSFGVPFFAPLAPRTKRSKDVIVRYPIFKQESRPDFLNSFKRDRQPKTSMQWRNQDPEYGHERKDDSND